MNTLESGALLFSEFQELIGCSKEYITRLNKNDPNITDLRRLVDITSEIVKLRNEIDNNIAKKNKKKSGLIQIKIGLMCAKENERYEICQRLIPILKTEIERKEGKCRSSSGAI